MASPTLKASFPEGLYRRVLEESARIGIDPPEFLRQAVATVLDSPRRREDFLTMDDRLKALQARLDALERSLADCVERNTK